MESISYQELLFIMSATYFFAGIIKGIIGIGLPTTGMAILCFFVNPITALGLNLIPMLISNLWQFYRADNHLKIIKEYKYFVISIFLNLIIVSVYNFIYMDYSNPFSHEVKRFKGYLNILTILVIILPFLQKTKIN